MAKTFKTKKPLVKLNKLSKVSNSQKMWDAVYDSSMAEYGDDDYAQMLANRAVLTYGVEDLSRRFREHVLNPVADAFSKIGL